VTAALGSTSSFDDDNDDDDDDDDDRRHTMHKYSLVSGTIQNRHPHLLSSISPLTPYRKDRERERGQGDVSVKVTQQYGAHHEHAGATTSHLAVEDQLSVRRSGANQLR